MDMHEIRRRTTRYFYEDGLIELMVGAALLVVSLLLLLFVIVPPNLTILMVFLLPIVGGGLVFGASKGAEYVKAQVVYPRTGYVAYRDPSDDAQRKIIVTGVLILTIIIALLPGQLDSIATSIGAIFALIFAVLGYRLTLSRFYVLAVASATIGVIVAVLLPPAYAATGIFAGIGLMMVLTGGYGLAQYLRRNEKEPDYDTD